MALPTRLTRICRRRPGSPTTWSGAYVFFFQAEDGIRDLTVTGVQTCALPISVRIVVFALLPSWGLANAAATLVGQGLGANQPDRAERAVWLAGFYNMLFLGSVGAVFVLLAGPIVDVFTRDPAVAPVAVVTLRTISYGFLFYAYGMVITQSFNGAGDTWTPTWINLGCFWLWEVPLAYWLARHAGLGPRGVALAVPLAFLSMAASRC